MVMDNLFPFTVIEAAEKKRKKKEGQFEPVDKILAANIHTVTRICSNRFCIQAISIQAINSLENLS